MSMDLITALTSNSSPITPMKVKRQGRKYRAQLVADIPDHIAKELIAWHCQTPQERKSYWAIVKVDCPELIDGEVCEKEG